jgi:transcriptional regulator with XRE-family HTH domain
MEALAQNLSDRVHMARRKLGLTQAEFAAKVRQDGLRARRWTTADISELENGKMDPRLSEMLDLAFALGQPLDWLTQPLDGFREFDSTIPGSINWDVEPTRIPADNINHNPTACIECLFDPNHLVLAEWLTPGGAIPGQTVFVIDLTDASFPVAEAV